jgi:ribonucleoside-diphosphate reductase alpha chain
MSNDEGHCPGQGSGTSKGNLRDCSEVTPGPKSDQRTAAARERLPNRRPAETIAFERDGSQYQMTVGFYPDDGLAGEIFLNHDRGDSLLDFLMSDAAILASLALQYGAPLDEIRHAIKRNIRGEAASPIGTALDRIET